MKKIISTLLITAGLSLSTFAAEPAAASPKDTNRTTCPSAGTETACTSSTCTSGCSSAPSSSSQSGNDVVGDNVLLDSTTANLEQSRKLLDMSINLLTVSKNVDDMENMSSDYLNAMLRLSDDISVMSDRLGKVADEIVLREDESEEMVSKNTIVSDMILANNAKTQDNLLEIEKNFNDLLIDLNQ